MQYPYAKQTMRLASTHPMTLQGKRESDPRDA